MASGIGRALLCGSALLLAGGYGCVRAARAEVGERLLGFGAELASSAAARADGPPRRLSVNGLELGLLTLSTRESVHDVLDRFHARCRARGGVAAPYSSRGGVASTLLDGSLREESESEGMIACLDTGRPLEVAELTARLRAFADGGDLAALGDLRYAFARRDGQRTTIVTLWTKGAARLFELFPETGDAPGRDPLDLPRPPASRRLLSGQEHGLPYSLTLYEVERLTARELTLWYESALLAAGWALVPAKGSRALMGRRGARSVSIHVSRTRRGQTIATVAELS